MTDTTPTPTTDPTDAEAHAMRGKDIGDSEVVDDVLAHPFKVRVVDVDDAEAHAYRRL